MQLSFSVVFIHKLKGEFQSLDANNEVHIKKRTRSEQEELNGHIGNINIHIDTVMSFDHFNAQQESLGDLTLQLEGSSNQILKNVTHSQNPHLSMVTNNYGEH